ncbi:type II and III secretion system protein family protein [Rhizorhabdus histidinilytica]|uniref:type II and III secretion system protein family protein n=1 Tax=Rhizorhabdus histidinilytica TaxID=439228 RepID=UPI00321FB2F9
MTRLLSTALVAAVALLGPASATAAEDSLSLQLKVKRVLDYPKPIARIQVDREGVIAVRAPSRRSLGITAIGTGFATLSVFAADGSLMGRTAISVGLPDGATGEVRSDEDDGSLSGTVDGLAARTALQRTSADRTPANAISVSGEQVVAVDVQFAAVSSSTLRALGFNFSKLSGDLQGAIVSPATLNSFNSTSSGLSLEATAPLQNAFNLFLSAPNRGITAVLSALSSNGLSQLLAQPTLLVRSGEQASFLAGGEVPIPVPQNTGNGNGIGIEYKEFGVRLKVTPFVLSKDRIILKIAPEVSELDYTNGVRLQGYMVPGLRRRSTETTVQLGSGQSFVIAGLTYSNSVVSKEKTPFLGDLPVLGALFKRQQNQRESQELIIVATPRLVGPMDPGQIPPLPGTTNEVDPTIGDMIVGTDGLEQSRAPFGVVRR